MHPVLQGKRVLVVEDDHANQKVASLFLKKMGSEPVLVSDGQEAVTLLMRESVDLVLMDCQLPVMDGFEATREIRRRISRTLPVIAMTANFDGSDRDRCFDAGMNDFVAKPVDFSKLVETMTVWLRRSDDHEQHD
jgi:CheY-like chemotaxis protein